MLCVRVIPRSAVPVFDNELKLLLFRLYFNTFWPLIFFASRLLRIIYGAGLADYGNFDFARVRHLFLNALRHVACHAQ